MLTKEHLHRRQDEDAMSKRETESGIKYAKICCWFADFWLHSRYCRVLPPARNRIGAFRVACLKARFCEILRFLLLLTEGDPFWNHPIDVRLFGSEIRKGKQTFRIHTRYDCTRTQVIHRKYECPQTSAPGNTWYRYAYWQAGECAKVNESRTKSQFY